MSNGCRALVLEGPGRLESRELPLPQLGEDDGLLRVEACGLCGTDHEQFAGLLPAPTGVPGHETVGVVEALGAAAQRWGVSVGDRVAVEVFQSCRTCPACLAADYRHCRVHGIGDMYGFIPVDRPPGLWGGYAQYQYLAPDSKVLAVPAGLDPVVATLFNPLGAGIRWGVEVPGTKADDVVAVLGPGVRGLSVAAAVRAAGAGFVLVVGKGPGDAGRLALAPHFGADLAVDAGSDLPGQLLAAAGRLADVVVDVTARAPEALGQAVALARPGGTIVLAGTRGSDASTPGFHPDLVVYKELRLLGALGVDTAAYRSALALLDEGRFPFADLPRRRVPLGAVSSLLESMGSPGSDRPVHGVVVPWE